MAGRPGVKPMGPAYALALTIAAAQAAHDRQHPPRSAKEGPPIHLNWSDEEEET